MNLIVKSVKEFNDIVLSILSKFKDGDNLESYLTQDHSLEFADSIQHCINKGYIDGISLHVSVIDEITFSIPNPKITRKGLEFLENNID